VTATFIGLGRIRKIVPGFWNGGQTFTIRFTPTIQGHWAYTTASSDAGLNKQVGSFQSIAPVPGNHGFLRRDARHPYSFVWDDGTRYFMFGQTYYELIRTAVAGGSWRTAVDMSQSYGLNKIRLLLYPWPAQETPYGDSQPFIEGDHDTLNLRHYMPVVNDEYGYIGEYEGTADSSSLETPQRRHRSVIWGITTAGGYGSAGDGRVFSDGIPIFSALWHDAPEYGDIRRLIDFFATREVPYWPMSSRNDLVTSGTRVYMLAERGKRYVIYAAVGGTFSAKLAPGTYAVQRYDPRTGEAVALPQVTGGGSRSFTMPDNDDWVLWLKAVR
jgi:hypothetical protein